MFAGVPDSIPGGGVYDFFSISAKDSLPISLSRFPSSSLTFSSSFEISFEHKTHSVRNYPMSEVLISSALRFTKQHKPFNTCSKCLSCTSNLHLAVEKIEQTKNIRARTHAFIPLQAHLFHYFLL